MKDSTDDKIKEDKSYDKIKHLVEVDDDILAVFITASNLIKELYTARNSHIDRNYVDSIATDLNLNIGLSNETTSTIKDIKSEGKGLLGRLKWIVLEYDKLRILKIFEIDKTIFVMIRSNTQLEHTVDNILGYYYDLDDLPKSLF